MTGRAMPVQEPWKIRVGRKAEEIASFQIPAHKLGSNEIDVFLRALVTRFRTSTAEEMIPYYVNGRRGSPTRSYLAEVQRCWSSDQKEQGKMCGDWECYAIATQKISDEHAAVVIRLRAESRLAPESDQ